MKQMYAFALGLGLALAATAVHATCQDDVDALAQQNQLSAMLPQAPSTNTKAPVNAVATNEKLAQSGGVLAPPAVQEGAGDVHTPPVPNPEPMSTAPAIMPKAEAPAAKDSQVQALLTAARAAAGQGHESECAQRLGDAKALLNKTDTKTP